MNRIFKDKLPKKMNEYTLKEILQYFYMLKENFYEHG